MSKAKRTWLIIAISLVLIGAGIFIAMLINSNGDFSNLNTAKYRTKTYESTQEFQDISIHTETADITFIFTEDSSARVISYEMEKAPHTVTFDSNKLVIEQNDQRMWYDHIGINFDAPKIQIYLPKTAYGALNIATITGDITIPTDFQFDGIEISATTGDIKLSANVTGAINVKATTGDLSVKDATCGSLSFTATTGRTEMTQIICHGEIRTNVSTGKTQLTNVRCNLLDSEGTTGDITMHNVIVNTTMNINRSTGDVSFQNCDAEDIVIRADTGDVTGNFLRSKIYHAESDTGRVSVPHSNTGGNCSIITNTGDIIITQ